MQYQMQLSTPIGYLRVVTTDEAVTEISFNEESLAPQAIKANAIAKMAIAQLREYLSHERNHFDLPLAPKGTDFQQNVWRQLQKVEYGSTASYLHIAKAIQKPTACRAVGAANGKNPIAIVIPCHRVIGANGKLTGYAGGLDRKSYLLQLESSSQFKLS